MKRLFGLFAMLVFFTPLCGQPDVIRIKKEEPQALKIKVSMQEDINGKYDRIPEYKGGIPALGKYLKEKIIIPEIKNSEKIICRISVNLTINKNGKIAKADLLSGCLACSVCNVEIIKALYKMPHWLPATIHNKPVKYKMVLNVVYEAES